MAGVVVQIVGGLAVLVPCIIICRAYTKRTEAMAELIEALDRGTSTAHLLTGRRIPTGERRRRSPPTLRRRGGLCKILLEEVEPNCGAK
jgi:hypothetical protein